MSALAAGVSRRMSGRVRTWAPRLLIHEAVALDRHAAVRAQRAIFTEEEPAIGHVVHQVHPEPGGEREEGGALAAAHTQPAAMVCRQIVEEHRRLIRHRAIRIRHPGTRNCRVLSAADEQRWAVEAGECAGTVDGRDRADARVRSSNARRRSALRVTERSDAGRVEMVEVRTRGVFRLLEQPVQARDGRQRIAGRGIGTERSHHHEAVRGELIHQPRIGAAPGIGGGLDDAFWRTLFGIVAGPIRPDQDGVAKPAGREIARAIDVKALLLPKDPIRDDARLGTDAPVGGHLERPGLRGIGRGPRLADTTRRRNAGRTRRAWVAARLRGPTRLRLGHGQLRDLLALSGGGDRSDGVHDWTILFVGALGGRRFSGSVRRGRQHRDGWRRLRRRHRIVARAATQGKRQRGAHQAVNRDRSAKAAGSRP